MLTFLVAVHGLIRWPMLVAGVAGFLRALWGWLGTLPFARSDNVLGMTYTGLIDLNVLLGIVLLVLVWSTPDRPTLGHPLLMILAAAVAHAGRMLGREREDRAQHQIQVAGIGVSLALILIGVTLVGK